MACRRHLAIVLSACLLANALSVPTDFSRRRRDFDDNELDGSKDSAAPLTLSLSKSEASTSSPTSTVGFDSFDDDDDDDDVFSEPMQTSPTGGSSIFSLLRLAGALFPGSSSANQDRASEHQQQQPASPIWTFKMDILRAILQFGTSVIGMASASSTNAITQ